MKRIVRAVCVLVAAAIMNVACNEVCSDRPQERAASSSAVAARSGTKSPRCPPRETPSWAPNGWRVWNDWSCECPFFVPASSNALPAPIRWQPCTTAPAGLDCRTMVVDWTDADTPIALDPELALDESNQPVLALQRNTTDSFVRMVASVDGPVRSAFMQARGQDCFVTLEDIAQGQWILSLFEKRGHAKGALGGSIRALHPAVVARQDQSSGEKDSYACSRWGYAKLDARFDFEARPWTATNARHVASRATDPQGLDFSQLVMHEGAIFWTTADRVRSGVNVWTPTANARPFLRDIDNSEYDAGNLGTDGENLVWTRSEGGTRSIVAASFTTDPSALDAKTLGSDPSPSVSGDAFRVACGFAAHGGKQAPVTVVRLRDGTRWSLASTFTGFEVANVIGITCDEIFLVGTFEGRVNVARVALSSLPLSTTR